MVFKVTEKQKDSIRFLTEFTELSPEEIRNHESMRRPDGTLHRMNTIKLWINRFKETGKTEELPKSGRPRKLNPVQENNLISFIKTNPKLRYPKVKRETGVNVSARTVNRRANEHGIKTFRCIKRPKLNIVNQKKRYLLAKYLLKHKYLIDLIVFTDEKKFMNSSESQIEYVNRMPNTAYEDKHIVYESSGSSVADLNVWGFIGSFGKGD